MIEQASASDGHEVVRKALGDLNIMIAMERDSPSDRSGAHLARLNRISDALIAATSPSAEESAEEIAKRLTDDVMTYAQMEGLTERGIAMAGIRYGFNAATQAAQTFPEPASVPSQLQMLLWLGVDFWDGYGDDGSNAWKIPAQSIEKE
ncbi:hypothetical protein [Streptomyces sp. AC495_CC817]|uniref:hypothetical protein n=1 Tax=Streptomyces sp. AC495_CC817 TaxID=2823900 RepID=UPI001C266F64|nr:hypothetical protein [Streptomyces sp. AC495_CC817]